MAERILFNELLRRGEFDGDATVGFDLDGYRLAGHTKAPHIAAMKGVLGDAVRFESGFTRASMALQARLERLHAQRADRVITVSRYCARQLDELYGVRNAIVIPELLDLAGWRMLFAKNPAPPGRNRFTVLCVCRFYRRTRVDVLLRAGVQLQQRIPELEIRIVGGGPEASRLCMLARELRLESTVDGWVMRLRIIWRASITARTCSACRAFRKDSGSYFWERWRQASRSSQPGRQPCRRLSSTAC